MPAIGNNSTALIVQENIGQPLPNQNPQHKSVKLALNKLELAQENYIEAQYALQQAYNNWGEKRDCVSRADEVIKKYQIHPDNSDTLRGIVQREELHAFTEVLTADSKLKKAKVELIQEQLNEALRNVHNETEGELWGKAAEISNLYKELIKMKNELASTNKGGL